MHDEAHVWTDKQIEKLQKDFRKVYRQASVEARVKLGKHMREFDKQNSEWKKRVAKEPELAGKYHAWLKSQAAKRDWIRSISNTLTEDAVRADQIASERIYNTVPSVYAENANRAAYAIQEGVGRQINEFTLYDKDTVLGLIADEPRLLPKFDETKDIMWNQKKFDSAITQAILQGESIPDTAKRLNNVMKMDMDAAVRAARTSMTSAENAGRVHSYKRALDLGIKLEQQWLATLDERTRVEHRLLDGQHVPVGEKFHVPGYGEEYDIEFPGDPTALPAMVWNCFIGDTLVAADSDIHASFCHEYTGDLITINTSSGVHFTCTPNHPILTPNGWVAANLLNNGDDILVTFRCNNYRTVGKPNIEHVFPSFNTIHQLLNIFAAKRASVVGVNFHGDVSTTNVEVVAKKSFLRFCLNASRDKSIVELFFKLSDSFDLGKRTSMQGIRGVAVSVSSFMRRLRIIKSLFRGHGSHANVHGLGSSTWFDFGVSKYTVNNLPAKTIIRRKLINGLSGQVFIDKVINVKVSSARCTHVYNLQTENGYYFANESNNGIFIIAKNCRCTLIPYFDDSEPITNNRWSKLPEDMTYEKWKETAPKYGTKKENE